MSKQANKTTAAANVAQKNYVVVAGFNYGAEDKRVKPGPLTEDLPADVLQDLLEQKAIVEEREVEANG